MKAVKIRVVIVVLAMTIVKNYLKGLAGTSYDRYVRKIALCEGTDPYEIEERCLRTEVSELPEITSIDLTMYLVKTSDFYTNEQMKAYKSLEAHTYFTSGFIKTIKHHILASGNVVVFGKVNHSQALSQTLLNAWVLCKKEGEILTAHCTCMAGNCSACSHVAAILYALEYAHRKREKATCTSLPNAWLPTYSNNAPYLEVRHYDFTSATGCKRKIDDSEAVIDSPQRPPKVPNLPTISSERFHQFLSEVFVTDKENCAVFRVAKHFCDDFETKDLVSLPSPLTELFDKSMCSKSDEELNRKCEEVWRDFKLTKHQCELIEQATRNQSKSKHWHRQRLGRITASVMKSICNADLHCPSITFLKNLCYNTQTFQSEAMKWGSAMEKTALNAYKDLMEKSHQDFKVQEAGLHVPCETPYLGASPDALTFCQCHGKGIVEIKCPSGVNSYVNDMNTLPTSHTYFYQIQATMMVTGVEWCDFYVWRPNPPCICIRVIADNDFQAEMKNKAESYFKQIVLPELIARKFSTLNHVLGEQGQQRKVICLCQKPLSPSDKVVICSTTKCTIRVYHLQCVGLKQARKKWKCQDCLKTKM